MNYAQKVALKLAATLLASAIAFCIGAFGTGTIVEHWFVPRWLGHSLLFGNTNARVFACVLTGGLAIALIVLVAGVIWTVKTSGEKETAEPQKII